MSIEYGSLNDLQLNENFLNQPTVTSPCQGVNLGELRRRLRAMLSSYAINTLIPSDTSNDLEAQYINDGIGQLWPHDYRVDMYSQLIASGQTVYIVPNECEFVFKVYTTLEDINTKQWRAEEVPHYDGWRFDYSFIESVSTLDENLQPWDNQFRKAVTIVDPMSIRASSNYKQSGRRYLIVRYARRWPALQTDLDCVNPSAQRVQAIVFYAAHAYITSQFEVNSESIRYQNYMGIANRFYQQFMQMLVKDSKPLYLS